MTVMQKIGRNRVRRVSATLTLFALVAAMALPAHALAQDPTASMYSPPKVIVASGGDQPTPSGVPAGETPVSGDSSGTLPFTGLDVLALAAVALALTGTGFALRRLAANGER
jgi:hypothetical protein